MSDATLSDLTIRQALAQIDRTQAETRKLLAEQGKLISEQGKLNRERAALPFQVMISGMAAGGALVAGTVALMKVLGG